MIVRTEDCLDREIVRTEGIVADRVIVRTALMLRTGDCRGQSDSENGPDAEGVTPAVTGVKGPAVVSR